MIFAPDLLAQASVNSQRGLRWISKHLDQILPSDFSDPEKFKEISELALFYGVIDRWQIADCTRPQKTIRKFLLGFLGNREIAQYGRKLPAHYAALFVAYLGIRMAGHRIQSYESALKILDRGGYPDSLEAVPFRKMEMQYVQWKAGLSQHRPSWGPTYRGTTLARCRTPLYLTNWEVYSITHTLFYQLDFAGPRFEMPIDERRRALSLTECLLVHYWRRADWDICAELLLNQIALDVEGSHVVFREATAAVFRAWRQNGALPSSSLSPALPRRSDEVDFRRYFHTTLVATLFCFALLYRYRSKPTPVK